jgi:hypothetical protein
VTRYLSADRLTAQVEPDEIAGANDETYGKDASQSRCCHGVFTLSRHAWIWPTVNGMSTLLIILILVLLLGGGGFYLGGPAYGGGGIGLILVICLILYLMGGFREGAASRETSHGEDGRHVVQFDIVSDFTADPIFTNN